MRDADVCVSTARPALGGNSSDVFQSLEYAGTGDGIGIGVGASLRQSWLVRDGNAHSKYCMLFGTQV